MLRALAAIVVAAHHKMSVQLAFGGLQAFRNVTIRFHDLAPEFAEELASLLRAGDEPDLADQILAAMVVEQCRCHDDFCASFYSAPPPRGSYGAGHRNVRVAPRVGTVILDVVDDRLMHVEILDNRAVRGLLRDTTV